MSVTALLLTWGVLAVLWLLWSYLVGVETERGSRVFLPRVRIFLDRLVSATARLVAGVVRYIDRHIIRLSWYYSLHSFLQAALRVVVSIYDYLESWFHQNRARARALRAERRTGRGESPVAVKTSPTHLAEIAEHKEQTALTEKQKVKLRTKKLEKG